MNEALLQHILNHPLFHSIRTSSVLDIVGYIRELRLSAGQVVCREGDENDGIYLVRSGSLSIRQQTDWGERELCRVKVPDLFGEMEALSPGPRLATIIAREESSVIRLDPPGFKRLVELEPGFILNISRELVQRIRLQDSVVSAELYKSYRALTFALANLTDSRDPETGSHLARTRNYCALLAEKLSHLADYTSLINADYIEGFSKCRCILKKLH
ncbi:MAG: cyclic nucleotide-binding domain-containing protein [Spirochaetota bacterium]